MELVSEFISPHNIKEEDVLRLRIETRHLELHLREHLPERISNNKQNDQALPVFKSPASLCNDHLCADVVELLPEVTGLEVDPGVSVTGLLAPRVLLHLQLGLEGPERLHLRVEVGGHQGGEGGHRAGGWAGGAHQALQLHQLCVCCDD